MVLAESENRVGLCRALINSKSGSKHKTNSKHRGNGAGRGGRGDGFEAVRERCRKMVLYTTEKHAADWYRMGSTTQQNDLYADRPLPANVRRRKSCENQNTARRTPSCTGVEALAELQEAKDLLMTPFERNLEVWGQLWRVTERSDLVVQIVGARNPPMFRGEDLERYVKEVDKRKTNLPLVNKADMMTAEQRSEWVDYFEKEGISYRFPSAALVKQTNEEYYSVDEEEEPVEEVVVVAAEEGKEAEFLLLTSLRRCFWNMPPLLRIKTRRALERTQIGLVGYPNFGKPS
ncbi:hypothetical protein C7212DRAFT_340051 [Tuber magnatum]|uniref:G domain-containing protein n=1 Tax=Tuber magnatum TaxID=42249 RepID=A0A317T088_9PEZI|nr:hypothetical protein C7212DRAFT_340051 [Tuber magnatum]